MNQRTNNDLIRIVLADANVLYSRVLRDYLLYAADQQVIVIVWSAAILDEVTEHLGKNVSGFDTEAEKRLVHAMNEAFPCAEVEPSAEHYQQLRDLPLPDEDDRHVLAAAVAAEATVLCTSNTRDFPTAVTEALGVEVLTPDELLTRLLVDDETRMLAAHDAAVRSLPGATDDSTIAALYRAGVPKTAKHAATLLGIAPSHMGKH